MFLKTALAEAREAALRPRDFFGRRPEAESWGAPAARLAFWGLAAGACEVLTVTLGLGDSPTSPILNLLTIILFPILTLMLATLVTPPIHLGWRLMGGTAPLAASWRATAAISFTMPLDTLTTNLGMMSLIPVVFRYWLLGVAGQGVHNIKAGRARTFAVALGFVELAARSLN